MDKQKKNMMNRILILLIGVLLISCDQSKTGKEKTEEHSANLIVKTENFDWLLGKWKRSNEEANKETFENWKKKSDTEYIGLGFTMQKGDTITQEKIKLIKSNDNWNLEVQLPEEPNAIVFKMTSFNDQEFICENKEHDFPNKIKYWKKGDKLNALVSGGEYEIPFEFKKLE